MTTSQGYQRFFAELKRRKVFRAAAVYGATGFVVLQVAELLAEGLNLSPAVLQTSTVLVLIGFPIVLVLAWALEMTPDGLKRTEDAAAGEIEAIVSQPASKRWPAGLLALAGVAALVGGAWYVGRATAPGKDGAAGLEATAAGGSAAAAEVSDEAVLNLAYADLSSDRRPAIAVLPFADMSAASDQEYFADGMTEELLNVLAKIRELRVAGRTSSFAYKDTNKDLREIGRELGVRYIVEGSVRKHENQLRITAQLIDTNDNFHVWSEAYNRTLDDVFAVQTEIAESIADALEVSLGIGGAEDLVTPTADLDAYEMYLTANARMRARGDGVAEAVRLFEGAVARDSGWAPAWAGLAQAHSLVPYYSTGARGSDRWTVWEESLDAAEVAANAALELDADNPAAEVALGNVNRDRWDWKQAEAHYLRALQIDPDNGEAHQQYAEYLAAVGRLDEALRSARRAVEVDPAPAIRNNALGYIAEFNGRETEAIAALERALLDRPDIVMLYQNLAVIYLSQGNIDRAEAVLMSEAAFDANPYAADPAGRVASERRIAAYFDAVRDRDTEALAACCSDPVYPVVFPSVFVVLGDAERGLDYLSSEILQNPGYNVNFLNTLWEPEWDPYRSDPRFVAALRHAGLDGVEVRRAAPASD